MPPSCCYPSPATHYFRRKILERPRRARRLRVACASNSMANSWVKLPTSARSSIFSCARAAYCSLPRCILCQLCRYRTCLARSPWPVFPQHWWVHAQHQRLSSDHDTKCQDTASISNIRGVLERPHLESSDALSYPHGPTIACFLSAGRGTHAVGPVCNISFM